MKPNEKNTLKQGGGAKGYDADHEQAEIQKEQDNMSKEYEPEELKQEENIDTHKKPETEVDDKGAAEG